MLVRYTGTSNGKHTKKAEIYLPAEHKISAQAVDSDARAIIRRLKNAGFQAYIVGGAVRDLLIGKKPKDFDIVTDASPGKIRRLFRRSRIIGRRFRLVHVESHGKLFEVSTFRSRDPSGKRRYGTIDEDVLRRDFTCNALLYCPEDKTVLDYSGGFTDIQKGILRSSIPYNELFTEDPVRIIRALKYSVSTGFKIERSLRKRLIKDVPRLESVSPSRLTEEYFKILESGFAAPLFREFTARDIVRYTLPQLDEFLNTNKTIRRDFLASLELLDAQTQAGKIANRHRALAYYIADYLYLRILSPEAPDFRDSISLVKQYIRPLVPPNRDVHKALSYLLRNKEQFLAERKNVR